MTQISPGKLLALGFIAGFLATLIFHQSAWYLLDHAGLVPADQHAWSMDPIPPFGVPSVISKAFWGGLWGALLALVLTLGAGSTYWLTAIVFGALAPSLVAMYVVTLIKGLPFPEFWPRIAIAATVNAAWGLGTAAFLRFFGAIR
jgi:hypothetical protein